MSDQLGLRIELTSDQNYTGSAAPSGGARPPATPFGGGNAPKGSAASPDGENLTKKAKPFVPSGEEKGKKDEPDWQGRAGSLRSGFSRVAKFAQGASQSPAGAAFGGAELAGGLGLGKTALAFTAAGVAVGATTVALGLLAKSINGTVARFSEFNATLAEGQAINEVKDLQQDIALADVFEQNFSEWQVAWGEFKRTSSAGWTAFKAVLAKGGAVVLKVLTGIMNILGDGFLAILKFLNGIKIIERIVPDALVEQLEELKNIRTEIEEGNRDDTIGIASLIENGGPFANMFQGFVKQYLGPRPVAPVRPAGAF